MKLTFTYGRWSRKAALSLGAVALSACCVHAAQAQFRTSVQGTVTDPSGAVIPNATLTLKDNQTNQTTVHKSDGNGIFNFNALPADHFTLTIEGDGFQKKVYNDLQFIPEQANSLQVQMQIGKTDTVVDVDGSAAPAMDTQTSNIGATVSANQIQHMPSFNRDVFTLSQLAPGVISDGSRSASGGVNTTPGNQGPGGTGNTGGFATENGVQANANGQQYGNNGISIDGISTVSAVWGGSTIITPNQDSIDNVRIVTNDYDAEDGRFAGAQTLVTSKSGTNQLHGSAYIAIHRPGLNAYNRRTIDSQTPIRNAQQYNQYGASLGGPIWKDKVFAFFSFESSPNSSNTPANSWFETSALRASAATNSIAYKYMNLTGSSPLGKLAAIQPTCSDIGLTEGQNCNTISGQGLDIGSPLTTGLGLQDLSSSGTNTTPGMGNGLDGIADVAFYNTESPTTSYYRQFNGRMDANISQKDHLAFTVYWVPQGSTSYNGGAARGYNYFIHDQVNQAMAVIWDHTFSPTLVNEARANVAGWRWNELTSNPQLPVGYPTASISLFAPGGSSGQQTALQSFGSSPGSHLDQWTMTYKDVLTKVLGRHTLKMGAEYTGLHYLLDPSGAPTYSFYNIWDFVNDAPYQEAGQFNYQTGLPGGVRQDERQNLWGGFIQDDWKITPSMTLHAGLRYSYFDSLYSKQNQLPSVALGSGASSFTDLHINLGTNMWTPQHLNFGPQVGFNWAPQSLNSKLVVRGGFGLSYNQQEIAITANTGYNPPTQNNYTFAYNNPADPGKNGADIVYGVSSNANSLNGLPSNPHTITSYNSNLLPTSGNASLVILGDGHGHVPTTYVQHYSLGADYQLAYNIVASVGYQGSVSRHLINHLSPNSYAVTRGYTLNSLIPNSGGDFWVNSGSANNNALLLELKHTMSHQFSLDGQFQLAKSMDVDGSGPYYEDPYYPANPANSYGPSDFNIGKQVKVFGMWQPVFFHGDKRWVEKVAGGWSLSGIYTWHTGYPFSPQYNLSQSLYCQGCGYTYLRPSYNGTAGTSHSNKSFINGTNFFNGNANAVGASTQTATVNGTENTAVAYNNKYFTVPDFTNSITWSSPTGFTPNVALPNNPGLRRNAFTGPGYRNVDASLAKSFGFPDNRVLGHNANLEIRADALNLFNLLNLDPAQMNSDITSANFGRDYVALGGRTISFTARFSF